MAKTMSRKSSVKASTSKTSGKTLPGYKTPGIEPKIHFYEVEDGDKTEEG